MVFQFRQTNNSLGHMEVYTKLDSWKGLGNVLVIGQFTFVVNIFQEILSGNDETRLMVFEFHWLTVIPRDFLSSFYSVSRRFEHLAMVVEEKNDQLSLWTTERVMDVSNQDFLLEWSPDSNGSDVPLDTMTVFPNHKYGLGGRTLRMVTIPWPPFVVRNEDENGTWYSGLCIDVLEYIARDLNFTYVISEMKERVWGQRLPNGTWVGMTAVLMRKEADFALSGLSVTADRATVTDYTKGFFYDEVVLLVSRPTAEAGWTFFLRPFHWLVYIVIGASLLLVTALHVCLERHGARVEGTHRTPLSLEGTGVVTCTTRAVYTFYGILLGRTVEYEGVSCAGHVLLSAWLMFSLITVATYTGKLTAFSVVTKEKVPFNTLRELVRQDDYRWGMMPNTYLDSVLSTSTNEDYRKYYQGVLEFARDDPSVLSRNLSVQLSKVVGGPYAYLSVSSVYHTYRARFCQLTTVSERLFTDTYAVHLQKGSPYTDLFNKAIEKAKELGLLDFWLRKWFPESTQCEADRAEVMSVTLDLMQSAFVMAVAGVGLAVLILTVEMFVRRFRHQH
ncbi:hypothetical protein BaRGS_00035850 [Batillaria attramentaria]|uniref:Uncharacterized protein n=1 Tax=Batillaria attramentaria TaxID=370345 RepID=A0ABD0JDC8_9CAEN